MSEREPRERLPGDPAAPHTMPVPKHVPRWVAWLLLAALAVSGALCVRMAVGV